MRAGSLVFYPLQITLLKFTEEIRRSNILSDRTICTYSPVWIDVENCSSLQSSNKSHDPTGNDRPTSGVTILQTPHESIEFSLKKVDKVASKGLPCRTFDNEAVLLHFMFTSYIADILEWEDLHSVKRRT